MKVLLDECLPRKLKAALTGQDVQTVPEMGWASIKNGKLLALMEPVFDVFVTIDGNLTYQQTLSGKSLALVVLAAPDNTLETLLPLIPQVLNALPTLAAGQILKVSASLKASELKKTSDEPSGVDDV